MVMGVSTAETLPLESRVISISPVARSLCGLRRWKAEAMAATLTHTKRAATLAQKLLLRYKLNLFLIRAEDMQLNDKAPDFALPNEQGATVSLKDYRGKTLVLFFYPKANTSG